MEVTFKAKTIEALRSGKYTQIHGRLKDGENCYCVVGLLCHLLGLSEDVDSFGGFMHSPPRVILSVISIHEVSILMTMNDSGKTFEEIANYLEAQ